MTDLLRGGWWASTAFTSNYDAHRVPVDSETALCGQRHRTWRAVTEFVRPEVFTRCRDCERLTGGDTRG